MPSPNAPALPGRVLVDIAVLVVGAYAISFARGEATYNHQGASLLVLAWFAFWGLDLLVTVLQNPNERWTRTVGGICGGICVLSGLAGLLALVSLPAWAVAAAVLLGIPGLVYAFTGRYLLARRPPAE